MDRVDSNKKLIQRRFYDSKGKAKKDIEYTNLGNPKEHPKEHPKVPHTHVWDWTKNLQEADGNKEKGVLILEYTYQEFIEDLNMGHEIEFLLDGDRYSISYNNTGWHVTKLGSEEYSTYGNVTELLENTKFNDNSFQEIWHKIKIDSIY